MHARPHPLYVLYDARHWLPFLLPPLLRAFLLPQDTLGIARDAAFALLAVGLSVWRWRRTRYRLGGRVTVRQGPLFWRTRTVAEGSAVSVEITRSPLMRLTRAVRVRVSTAGVRRRADATLLLAQSQLAALLPTDADDDFSGRVQLGKLLVMAVSGSNAALSLLTLSPALRQTAAFLGGGLTDGVYRFIDRLLALGLPPLLETAANLLLIGWGFAAVRDLLRYGGFRARREGDRLHIRFGPLTRTDTLIDARRITALEWRQTLFMRLFRLYTVSLAAAGYGRERGAHPVIVPAASRREARDRLDRLLPGFPRQPIRLRPPPRGRAGYAAAPLTLCAAALLPLWFGGIGRAVAAAMLGFGVWWLIVRLIGFAQAGVGIGREAVILRYPRGLALYEVLVPLDAVDCLLITRSPWQRHTGTCTLELRCFGEKHRRHRVRTLPYAPLVEQVYGEKR